MTAPATAPPPASTGRTAIVVGAGIGGLAAALALSQAGWRVRVLERSHTLDQTGFGLALAPGGMAALEELGLGSAIRRHGHLPSLIEIRGANGTILRQIDLRAFSRRSGPPLLMLERSVLHTCLIEALGGDSIDLGAEVVTCSVTNRPAVTTTGGRRLEADIVVGADGVGSLVRRILHPAEDSARLSGYWALRGLARGVTDRLGNRSGIACLAPGIEAAAIRAGDDVIYWYVSLLAEAVAPGDTTAAAVLDRCPVMRDPTLRAITDASRGHAMRLDSLFVRDPLPAWGAGPVTLLGDAAHPVLPHTGHGATLALQDAVALGLALRSAADPAAGLRRYEAARQPPAERLMRRGPLAARVTTTRSAVVGSLRDAAIRFAPLRPAALALRLMPSRDPHRQLR
jgi:2-polyprenyl-6-methoxyphenol hydroxylase-like FAD-dependent oxidoreductase